jgi:hypothetical protein
MAGEDRPSRDLSPRLGMATRGSQRRLRIVALEEPTVAPIVFGFGRSCPA